MKKCLVSHAALGLSLVALPFIGGCTQQKGGSNLFASSANAEAISAAETVTNVPAAPAEPAIGLAADTNSPVIVQTNVPVTAQTNVVSEIVVEPTEQKTPPNLQLSPVLSEAVKLVQSGVDQAVLFHFITNTTGYFSLGADEIVYLNDLGVEGNVITTMMEHDKALRELRANAWQAYAASNQTAQLPEPEPSQPSEEMAAAPSYVEQPPTEPEPVYVSNTYFYDTLSPYGTWVYVPGYGRCWRPTAAYCNPGWRPYVDRGRWVYSDAGWYWLSDYTWGATTFHYGRWFNDSRLGWCWWPDTVWAPSWVSWRYTSDYCGWAPLPPNCYYQSGFGLMYASGSVGVSFGFGLGVSSYAFVPWGTFCSPKPYKHCLPTSSAVHVYNNSRPHNNWEAGGKGKAYNRGIAPERVRELSRTEVRTVSVKEQTARAQRAERIDRDGRTLTVRRPQFNDTANLTDTGGTVARSGQRQTVGRTTEATVATPRQPATTTLNSAPTPEPAGRVERRPSQPDQRIVTRTDRRTPVTPTSSPTIESKSVVTAPTRGENRPERTAIAETVDRRQPTSPIVVRSTQQPAARPTASRPANPPVVTSPTTDTAPAETRAAQTRVTQPNQTASRPTAAQRSSIIVIGNPNNNRSGGRDYSVWSTSPQTPATTSPSLETASPRNTPPPATVNPPQVADNSPALATRAENGNSRNGNGNSQNRGNNSNRSDNRGNNLTDSAQQTGQVNVPSARSTPAANYNYNARPSQSAPAQSFVPRSQPAVPAAQPSAPRVESRPAAAQSRPSSPASQPGQSQGRPNR